MLDVLMLDLVGLVDFVVSRIGYSTVILGDNVAHVWFSMGFLNDGR